LLVHLAPQDGDGGPIGRRHEGTAVVTTVRHGGGVDLHPIGDPIPLGVEADTATIDRKVRRGAEGTRSPPEVADRTRDGDAIRGGTRGASRDDAQSEGGRGGVDIGTPSASPLIGGVPILETVDQAIGAGNGGTGPRRGRGDGRGNRGGRGRTKRGGGTHE